MLDTSPTPVREPGARDERFAAAIRAEREVVRRFLASHHERIARAASALEEQIARLEEAARSAPLPTDRAASGDYQRRYEMALDDLRELKERNAELLRQLAKRPPANPTASADGREIPAGLDWESEKRRILAALEADRVADNPAVRLPTAERLRIEEVMRTTERALAEKDREIAELRRQLEAATPDPDAAPSAEIDRAVEAAVVEERERLRLLQEQWHEKLRTAEIEISTERAKLARERIELEEQRRLLETGGPRPEAKPEAAPAESHSGTRWLTRLGLTEADRERGRRHRY